MFVSVVSPKEPKMLRGSSCSEYRGLPEGFLFEGTRADVSCFFTEGYGFMFLILVAPGLALATFLGELIILKASGHGQSGFNPAQGAP
jgi:hypothetical protein